MYNSEHPRKEDLPSTARLIRSTVIALVSAIIILVTIVLPAEYGKDPTGIGRLLGLAEMGEIKEQLAREAEEDRLRDRQNAQPAGPSTSSIIKRYMLALLVTPAHAQEKAWTDEITLKLEPGQGVEIKLVMKEAAKAEFSWSVTEGKANYDLHGDGSGQSISYKKGRGATGEDGVLEAAFDGNHGWFWRNRDKKDITIVLKVRGDYSEIKKYL